MSKVKVFSCFLSGEQNYQSPFANIGFAKAPTLLKKNCCVVHHILKPFIYNTLTSEKSLLQ